MRQNFTKTNRMSNTTKIEMLTEMKPGNTEKEENAEKGRSLRSRRVNYTIDLKQQ